MEGGLEEAALCARAGGEEGGVRNVVKGAGEVVSRGEDVDAVVAADLDHATRRPVIVHGSPGAEKGRRRLPIFVRRRRRVGGGEFDKVRGKCRGDDWRQRLNGVGGSERYEHEREQDATLAL